MPKTCHVIEIFGTTANMNIKEVVDECLNRYDFSWSTVDWSLNPKLYSNRDARRLEWKEYYTKVLAKSKRHAKYMLRTYGR